jgi:tripartite-type tricarboxylate transporter receptor subunit TctC
MKLLHRRQFLHSAGGAVALPVVARVAKAQTYPTRPITMIVSFVPGGFNDAIARVMAERMRRSLGQPIIIENVGGANGSIGTGRAARAKPDGYTIDIGNMNTHVLNGAFYTLPYDVLNDFSPILPLATGPSLLLATTTIPARDLKGLIAWLMGNPNKASIGIVTVGYRLLATFFQKETRTQFNLIPYRGGGAAMQDLVAGQIDLLFTTPDKLPMLQTGSVRAYAVTSDRRLMLAPDIPTFAEMGLPMLSYSDWLGVFAPRGTPKDIIDKLGAAAVGALGDPTVRSRLGDLGMEIFPRERQTPEALAALVKMDAEKWWPIIKEFGIKML